MTAIYTTLDNELNICVCHPLCSHIIILKKHGQIFYDGKFSVAF
jgi:hypothetical protein